jgi:hypothetical protein
MASNGMIQRKGSAEEDAEEALEALISETKTRLSADPLRSVYADLKMTMSSLDWVRKNRMIIDATVKLLESSNHTGEGRSTRHSRNLEYKDLPRVGRWSEIWIIAPRLRLRGRMDIVEMETDSVSVRDLKTGRIEDSAGQVLEHIASQMQLYGLMVNEMERSRKRVRLFVEQTEDLEIPFDVDTIASTEQRLWAVLDQLPEGATKKAGELATPDASCRFCSFRHRCGSYLEDAPGKWNSGSRYIMPTDAWGIVDRIELRREGNTMAIRDAEDRTLKVFGLRDALVVDVGVGKNVWLFGLSAKRVAYDGEMYRHPLNFFESDPNNPWSRAWALQVFLD